MSRGGGRRARLCPPHTRPGGGGGGRGGGGPGRARGREEAPGCGGRGAADAETRDARGGRRLGAAARRGAQEARQARGDPESSMKSPRGRGRGAGLGRLSGGPRHSWQGGGRGGVLGVSRGLGGRVGRAGRGRPEWGRSDSGPGQGGPGCSVSVSVCGASSEPGGVASPLPLLSSVAFLETCKCFRRGGEGGARE